MGNSTIIRGAKVVNEGTIQELDVEITSGRISKISSPGQIPTTGNEVDGRGKYLIPGMIDDQVHFREPGLTHKAEIETEARAAVAGGITSFMEMPNTVPNTLTQDLLEEKYQRASEVSLANYSFFMGASNGNLAEVLKTDPQRVCGVKVFMGSSTGDMLVDNRDTLSALFAECPMLIATHCEDEATIQANLAAAKAQFGDDIPIAQHPIIRNAEACYLSSSMAVDLATKHNTRLHILHISTARETALFRNDIPLEEKRITAEACIHHLWFSDADYQTHGTHIKWNPAVKSVPDREAVLAALLDNRIDVLATDHAPHTLEEKTQSYLKAPSGGPLVQHAIPALLEMSLQGKISIEKIVEKASHAVARCFEIKDRGFIQEGFWADLVLVDMDNPWEVNKTNIEYKCGWSPFEGQKFSSRISKTWVNGHLAYDNGQFNETQKGSRLAFDR